MQTTMTRVTTALALTALAACTRGQPSAQTSKIVAVADKLAPTQPIDAGASVTPPPASRSSFAVIVEGPLTGFQDTGAGSLLATTGDVLYVLAPDGTVRPLEPLVMATAGKFERPGRVAGQWPQELLVELVTGTDRSGLRERVVTVSESGTNGVVTSRGTNAHYVPAGAWSEGRTLAFRAEGTSAMPMWSNGWRGSFVALRGAPVSVPIAPPDAVFAGDFAAYESGLIFALGGVIKKNDPTSGNLIWDWNGKRWAKTALPELSEEPNVRLARGRNENEALVYGEDEAKKSYLARRDGEKWVRVEVGIADAIRSLSVGSDGSVWLVAGVHGENGDVYRGAFPALKFTRVALPEVPCDPSRATSKKAPIPCGPNATTTLTASDVAARSASDVWLIAAPVGSRQIMVNRLLHSQAKGPATPPKILETEELERELLNKKPAPKYGPTCLFPFLVLGEANELDEAKAKALVAKILGEGDPEPSRYRLFGNREVWGIELSASRPPPKRVFDAVRARRPSADLVCTKPIWLNGNPMMP